MLLKNTSFKLSVLSRRNIVLSVIYVLNNQLLISSIRHLLVIFVQR